MTRTILIRIEEEIQEDLKEEAEIDPDQATEEEIIQKDLGIQKMDNFIEAEVKEEHIETEQTAETGKTDPKAMVEDFLMTQEEDIEKNHQVEHWEIEAIVEIETAK